jgi:hypothetical protein
MSGPGKRLTVAAGKDENVGVDKGCRSTRDRGT